MQCHSTTEKGTSSSEVKRTLSCHSVWRIVSVAVNMLLVLSHICNFPHVLFHSDFSEILTKKWLILRKTKWRFHKANIFQCPGCRQLLSHSVSFPIPPGCLFALGKEVKNLPKLKYAGFSPRVNTYITASRLLIEALFNFFSLCFASWSDLLSLLTVLHWPGTLLYLGVVLPSGINILLNIIFRWK